MRGVLLPLAHGGGAHRACEYRLLSVSDAAAVWFESHSATIWQLPKRAFAPANAVGAESRPPMPADRFAPSRPQAPLPTGTRPNSAGQTFRFGGYAGRPNRFLVGVALPKCARTSHSVLVCEAPGACGRFQAPSPLSLPVASARSHRGWPCLAHLSPSPIPSRQAPVHVVHRSRQRPPDAHGYRAQACTRGGGSAYSVVHPPLASSKKGSAVDCRPSEMWR